MRVRATKRCACPSGLLTAEMVQSLRAVAVSSARRTARLLTTPHPPECARIRAARAASYAFCLHTLYTLKKAAHLPLSV